MDDIPFDNLRPDLKQEIEDLARAKNRSFTREAEDLLERGLDQVRGAQAFSRDDHPCEPGPLRVEDFFPPRLEGERGLGSDLAALVPDEFWDDDFIQPREPGQRPPPDFR